MCVVFAMILSGSTNHKDGTFLPLALQKTVETSPGGVDQSRFVFEYRANILCLQHEKVCFRAYKHVLDGFKVQMDSWIQSKPTVPVHFLVLHTNLGYWYWLQIQKTTLLRGVKYCLVCLLLELTSLYPSGFLLP
jgi:hypothetical protein